jgi:glycosyltransferase involved in cell wall biosynthesis
VNLAGGVREPDAVLVVIPARDEQERVASCVRSVRTALDVVRAGAPRQCVVLVADGCTDATATMARMGWAVAGGHDGELVVVATAAVGVGSARRLGVLVGLAELGRPLERTWVATTDADSRVPASWLAAQLDWAGRGYDGVAGTVRVGDWSGRDLRVRRDYERVLADARVAGGRHRDVFGANLGIRASALSAVGGFPGVRVGEDHAVWDALAADGAATVAPADLVVTTSGRRDGRAPGGLADLLTEMESVR